jgi:hypothetical protein
LRVVAVPSSLPRPLPVAGHRPVQAESRLESFMSIAFLWIFLIGAPLLWAIIDKMRT